MANNGKHDRMVKVVAWILVWTMVASLFAYVIIALANN